MGRGGLPMATAQALRASTATALGRCYASGPALSPTLSPDWDLSVAAFTSYRTPISHIRKHIWIMEIGEKLVKFEAAGL